MEQSLKTVWLYGALRKKCGVDKVQIRGGSVKELIEALSANFKTKLQPTPESPRLLCKVKDFDTPEKLMEPIPEGVDDIHIYPCLTGGGGNGGLWKIVIGALIIATAIFAAPLLGAWGVFVSASTGALTTLGTIAVTIGAGMIIGGLMDIMFPQPKIDLTTGANVESSKYLGSTGNTTKIGTPIPIIFGEILHYGQIISFNVDAVDVAV